MLALSHFCLVDAGLSETVEDRLGITSTIVEDIEKEEIQQDDSYLDPLIKLLGTNDHYDKIVWRHSVNKE